MMPKVTVLLPVYNGEQYLREAILSILNQSYSNFEFLIIDDGSTDSSPAVVRSFSDSRIRVLTNPTRLKLSGALNRGMDEARGKYIARMDADDISLPLRLKTQVDFLESHPEVGLCGTAIEIFGTEEKKRIDNYPEESKQISAYMLFDCPFCHPAVMIRKTLFNEHNLRYNGSYYPTEDYELWSRATAFFPTINLGEVLLRYRVHGLSMTGADWDKMDKQATRIIKTLLNILDFQFSAEELKNHRNIGRGRSCRVKNVDDLDGSDNWLKKLIIVNSEKNVYDRRALAEAISLIWYRLCLNNTHLGLKVFNKYRSSSLIKSDPMKSEHVSILLASVLKNTLFIKRFVE